MKGGFIFFCKIIIILILFSTGDVLYKKSGIYGWTKVVTSNAHSTVSLTTESKKNWKLIGPGDADQVTALTLTNNGMIYLGTDIGGVYRSTDRGESWQALNNGLRNYDVTTPIIVDPQDNSILYVGTRGGFYKSTDGGMIWYNKRKGLPKKEENRLSGSIGGIVLDPNNSKTIYLGIGYRQSSDGTTTVRRQKWSNYIYKSTNRGESWTANKAFKKHAKVNQLVHSPTKAGIIYSATSEGVYVGVDGGRSWKKLFEKETLSLILFENNPDRIMIACGSSGIYESTDSGQNWRKCNNGLSFWYHPSGKNRYSFLAKSSDGKFIYALNSTWGRSGGLYVSDNNEISWRLLSRELPESWLKMSRRMNALAVSEEDPNLIFLGSSRYIYRTRTRGSTWEQIISKARNSGWIHRGLNVFGHTRDVEVDPSDLRKIYIATADHGIVKSNDGGKSWNKVKGYMKFGESVLDIAFCDGKNTTMFAASKGTSGKACISSSIDDGRRWNSLCGGLDRNIEINKILIDKSNQGCKRIFLATSKGVTMTNDAGRSWRKLGDGLPKIPVYSIQFDPENREVIYAGTKKGLYRTRDGGKTWKQLRIKEGVQVTSIMVSRLNHLVILVGTERNRYGNGAIYKSADAGKTWKLVLGDIRKYVSGIVELPGKQMIIYASTNDHNYHDESQGSGIFRSDDHGLTWKSINLELPVLRAWNITVSDLYPMRVFLSSNGSGAYILDELALKGKSTHHGNNRGSAYSEADLLPLQRKRP